MIVPWKVESLPCRIYEKLKKCSKLLRFLDWWLLSVRICTRLVETVWTEWDFFQKPVGKQALIMIKKIIEEWSLKNCVKSRYYIHLYSHFLKKNYGLPQQTEQILILFLILEERLFYKGIKKCYNNEFQYNVYLPHVLYQYIYIHVGRSILSSYKIQFINQI